MSKKQLNDGANHVWVRILKTMNLIPVLFHLVFFLLLIIIPHKENIGALLGGLAICIGFHAFALVVTKELNDFIRHKKKFMLTIVSVVSIMFFFLGILFTTNTYKGIVSGAEEKKGILISVIDEGKYIKSPTNHNIKIKINTFKSDLTMLRTMDYYNKLKKFEGKEITVVFYPNSNSFIRLKEIND